MVVVVVIVRRRRVAPRNGTIQVALVVVTLAIVTSLPTRSEDARKTTIVRICISTSVGAYELRCKDFDVHVTAMAVEITDFVQTRIVLVIIHMQSVLDGIIPLGCGSHCTLFVLFCSCDTEVIVSIVVVIENYCFPDVEPDSVPFGIEEPQAVVLITERV